MGIDPISLLVIGAVAAAATVGTVAATGGFSGGGATSSGGAPAAPAPLPTAPTPEASLADAQLAADQRRKTILSTGGQTAPSGAVGAGLPATPQKTLLGS